MMADFNSCLYVDKAAYSSVLLALDSLDPETFSLIKTWDQECQEQPIAQVAQFLEQYSCFMGIAKPTCMSTNQATLTLELDELSEKGLLTGKSFLLTLNSEISKQWFSHPTMKLVNPAENFLIVFQRIPGRVKMLTKEIHFCVGSKQVNARILVKHYFNTFANISSFRNENLLTLTEAIAMRPPSFDVFAVVRYVVKKPGITNSGTGHGMFSMIDPSCEPDRCTTGYIAQIFANSLNVFPVIEAGDIIKFERISTQTSLKKKDAVELVVKHDKQLIVFPNGVNWEDPRSPADYYMITEEDFTTIRNLKKWYREQMINRSTPHTPISAQKPANSQSAENTRQEETFSRDVSTCDIATGISSNFKKCSLIDLSAQSESDEQESSFEQNLDNLKGVFAHHSSFDENVSRLKRRPLNSLEIRPRKRGRTELISSRIAQQAFELQLIKDSYSRYIADLESA